MYRIRIDITGKDWDDVLEELERAYMQARDGHSQIEHTFDGGSLSMRTVQRSES